MSAFEERVRGARARQILDDPIYNEAIVSAQDSLVSDLINVDVTAEDAPIKALRGVMRVQALFYVTQAITSIATTGEMAESEDA